MPVQNPPVTPPAETVSAVPAPSAGDVAKAAKPKRTTKPPAPDKSAKIIPPAPAPQPVVVPVPPPPAPVATPAPPPNPAPKPVIQTPVMVADSLPFVINLAEDVPADAPEGQAVRFTVGEDLRVGGQTVIEKGATVTGAVMGESGKKFLGIGGHKLTFRLTQAEAVDGRKLAVRAMAGKGGDGPAIRTFDTAKGSKPKGFAALQGTVYVGYVDGDQMVSVRQ